MNARINPSNRAMSRSGSCNRYHHCSLPGEVSIFHVGVMASTNVLSTFVPTSSTISASPAVLRRSHEPLGADNDAWMRARVASLRPGDAVWLGWGNGGRWRDRHRAVLAMLEAALPADTPLLALALTAAGQPRHPLYAPAAAQPLRLLHPGDVLRFAAPP